MQIAQVAPKTWLGKVECDVTVDLIRFIVTPPRLVVVVLLLFVSGSATIYEQVLLLPLLPELVLLLVLLLLQALLLLLLCLVLLFIASCCYYLYITATAGAATAFVASAAIAAANIYEYLWCPSPEHPHADRGHDHHREADPRVVLCDLSRTLRSVKNERRQSKRRGNPVRYVW